MRLQHPFLNPSQLEGEANTLLEECITTLYTSRIPDIVSTLTTMSTTLVKVRPMFAQLVITALTNWTPAALEGQGSIAIRSVEKTVRASVTHLLK